ncbi:MULTISPECIES: hypothetical protein [Alcanivorax]|jgi:hypothetical protein|uniref:hypothetical protein n=2 Tax=Alcanivoracaceae TaxID=224372 RepID=UPI000C5D9F7B|nr:hypothetical protein [Alcanivorax jadensis]MBG31784.1 hypothetical protein [Alcanivorax sp.]MDF1637102.1 hypothetical protein [Alcanivorax jadensis]|tara:strand:- start:63 stop:503 length:441 start_codon:yes stop_codon:yes gene_type:complete
MRFSVFLLIFLFFKVVNADVLFDCGSDGLSRYENKVCEHQKLVDEKEMYRNLMVSLREALKNNIEEEKVNPLGWGVSSKEALKSINESDFLWQKLHVLNCSIEIGSPSFASGSSMPAEENYCFLKRYMERNKQLRSFIEAWQIEVQ